MVYAMSRVEPRRADPHTDTQVWRDGRLHVCREMCSTCVFRPGNLMSLDPGALRSIIEGNLANGAALTCHQTLPYAPGGGKGLICRGFFDRYKTKVAALGLGEALDVIEEGDPPCQET